MKFYRNFLLTVTLLGLLTTTTLAQSRIVSGVVKDSNGDAVAGVTVQVKGTANGTVTDSDGKYSLSLDTDNALLVFSFIGYANQEIHVGTQSIIDVTLKEDTKHLQEIVVVGYGEQKKENLTGAVATINTKNAFDSRPIADASRGLQGMAPGMSIDFANGQVGTDPVIRIRGQISSIQGASQPLILLDNVEIPSIQLVNPQDIESISILKDAASASIYGAKGAFGVILITSKKGTKKESVQVSYQANVSFQNISRKMEMAGVDGLRYSLDAAERPEIGGTKAGAFILTDEQSYAKAVQWQQTYGKSVKWNDPILYGRDYYYDPGAGGVFGLRTYDPFKAIVRSWAPTTIHNLSINGRNGSTSYNIGIGYTMQNGMNQAAKKDQFQRYNGSVQLNTEVNKWLKINYGAMYSKRITSYPNASPTSTADPYLYLYRWSELMPNGAAENGVLGYGPYEQFHDAATATLENNFANVNTGFTLTPTKDWLINFNYTYNNEENINVRPGTRFYGADTWQIYAGGMKPVNDVNGNPIYVDNTGQVVDASAPGAMRDYKMGVGYITGVGSSPDNFYRAAQNNQRNTINLYSTYDLKIQENHTFKFMVGMNKVGYKSEYNWSQITQLIDYTNPQFNLATGTQTTGGDKNWDSQLGFFGRLNYNYKEKYLLEANVRRDASSKFPKDLRWATFPSFSAGWHLDKEAFMDFSKNFLDQFKIRASWGSIGDQTVPNGLYVPTLSSSQTSWLISGAKPFQFSTPAAVSSSIGWQNISTLDIGTDIRVLNNALGLTVDWYQRDTQGMIVPEAGLPTTYGTTAPQGNFGSLRTKGIEFALDYNHTFSNGLRVNFVAITSNAITKITKYGTVTSIDDWYVGKTYGEIWGYQTDRLFQKSDFVYNSPGDPAPATTVVNGRTVYQFADGNTPIQGKEILSGAGSSSSFKFGPGDVKFKDLNHDGVITPGSRTVNDHGDLKVIGNSTPRWEYSFRAGASWKGFDFSFFLQGVGSRQLWGDGSLAIPGYNSSDGGMPQAFASNFWRSDRTGAFYPRPWNQGSSNVGNNMQPQSRYLLNMAYLRVKNIQLGYNLPESVIRRAHLTRVRVYISLENFFTFSHLGTLPIDPENIPGVTSVYNASNSINNGNFGNAVIGSASGTSPTVGTSSFPRTGMSIPTFKSASGGVQITF
ncbi:MAG: SusC/RagA family TonB-linked outer membrane protein [Cytophagales bacterium]|jgi:TonB-linked SusC/RagA family outer membrane protein|nr:SusC/RagA family TonB-linked outer membrane protein [Bacteroidota bacterium]MBS1981372.1 SusC/RagA family TonB-linked outer membrane protein [Bacteroidota bacterium]WHZ06816.1 MAG: SusC/RagA family TonB-linked outer membrane protein [Cytophagales bacterium]